MFVRLWAKYFLFQFTVKANRICMLFILLLIKKTLLKPCTRPQKHHCAATKAFIANCKSRAVSSRELLGCWLMPWQITDNQCDTPRFPVEKQKMLNYTMSSLQSRESVEFAREGMATTLIKSPEPFFPSSGGAVQCLHSQSGQQCRGRLCSLGYSDLF